MTKKKAKIKVRQTDKESGVSEIVSLEYAIEKLENWWKAETIEPMLIDGQIMFTPYYTYQIHNKLFVK